MIKINSVLNQVPAFKSFCCLEQIYRFIKHLASDSQFKVETPEISEEGRPIYHIRFGTGGIKVLFVGYPHPNEPIGGNTALALLALLHKRCPEIIAQDIEWHIVPCVDPDGAVLNEGWSKHPFSFKRHMKSFYRQHESCQVEWSFPIKYKKLNFNKPTRGAKALMKIFRAVKPDFYFSLHDATLGGAYYYISKDIGNHYYRQFYQLLKKYNIPLQGGEAEAPFIKTYDEAVYSEITIKDEYAHLEKFEKDPSKYIKCGGDSFSYLRQFNRQAVTLVCELPYLKHSLTTSRRKSGQNRRRLFLQKTADRKFLASLMLEEWDKVKDVVNKHSPFYRQAASQFPETRKHLHEVSKEILFDPSYNRSASKSEEHDIHMSTYDSLCWNYHFVRLLNDSARTNAIKSAQKKTEKLITEIFNETDKIVDFSSFTQIDISSLVKAQLGSGLIVINSILAAHF